MKLSNFTKCQLTAGKVSGVAGSIDKHWKKMRVCHNVAKSVNEVPHRQSISHGVYKPVSEIPSRQRLVKGNSIEAEACKGKFHQGRSL